ncbi:tyrosine-type recombinase/integrase [Pedobacter sp. GSP4]|uniref:tyrosine-type recombinase/integrase n=1 Tax=Pedobacter sp. GSP4 TaxID=3453716 RepID=UPI003EEB61B2
MEQRSIINPHCSEPKLLKDKFRWSIRFYFKVEGETKTRKKDYGLNGSEFLKKDKGVIKAVNKSDRIMYAAELLKAEIIRLNSMYFNPFTKEFESLDKSDQSFISLLADYLDYSPNKVRRESTKAIYKSYNNRIKDVLAELGSQDAALNEVDRSVVEALLAKIQSKSSKAQRDHYLRYLKGFFTYCVDHLEIITKSPIKTLKNINNEDTQTNKAYSSELQQKVLDEAKRLDPHFHLLLRLLIITLRRPDELLRLQLKDFDFKTGSVTFSRDKIKTDRAQIAFLSEDLVAELKCMMDGKYAQTDYFLGHAVKESKARTEKSIFAPVKTSFVHFQDKFKTVQKRLGLEKGYTIYSFKHTSINNLIDKHGWSKEKVIKLTGHTNTSILDTYTKDGKRERIEYPDII